MHLSFILYFSSKMNREKNLETILVLCLALIVFYLIFHIKVLLTFALLIGFLGVFSDFMAAKITWLWLKIAEVMGLVVSKILLSLVFFLFLTPLAFLMKLSGKGSMKIKKEQSSMFDNCNHTYKPVDMENIW